MAFTSGFLRDDSLRADENGFALEVGLPWMRALPWSSIQGLRLVLDGVEIPSSDLAFEINGDQLSLAQLADHWEEYWAIYHPLRLIVARAEPLRRDAQVRLQATAELRIPYLSVGPGTAMVVESSAERTLTVLPA